MNSIKSLLGMIATEAVEVVAASKILKDKSAQNYLPPIHYDLELIRESDGRLVWYE